MNLHQLDRTLPIRTSWRGKVVKGFTFLRSQTLTLYISSSSYLANMEYKQSSSDTVLHESDHLLSLQICRGTKKVSSFNTTLSGQSTSQAYNFRIIWRHI